MSELSLILVILAGLSFIVQTSLVVAIVKGSTSRTTYFLGYYLAAGLLIAAVLL